MSFLKKIKIPHVFVLLTIIILICSVATYLIPSGSFEREERTVGEMTRTMVVPGTYSQIPKHISPAQLIIGEDEEGKASPVSIVGFLSAIPRGLENSADIIFFIFIIGGVFGIFQRTGTISALLQKMVDKFSNSSALLTILIMTAVAVGGSSLGMGEEFIPLVPVFLIVSYKLGYDRIYGLAMVMLAADVGFAAATTNPFTVQIAQGISEVPLGSGIGFRLIFLVVILSVTIAYVLRYGARISKNPAASIMAGDTFSAEEYDIEKIPLRASHKWIVVVCAAIFGLILLAVQKLGWWMAEMAGGFLLMGFAAVIISKLPLSEATKAFVKGMEEMVVAALVVGFARGIQVVLEDGQIMDTIIYGAATLLDNFSTFVAVEGMLVFQSGLNFFIPSGSGQAAVTMPLMAPLADVLGVTRQTAVMAFTSGDGFSNTIVPTSGVLMAMLSLAKIPYGRWLKFVFPLFLLLMLIAGIFLAIAVKTGYS